MNTPVTGLTFENVNGTSSLYDKSSEDRFDYAVLATNLHGVRVSLIKYACLIAGPVSVARMRHSVTDPHRPHFLRKSSLQSILKSSSSNDVDERYGLSTLRERVSYLEIAPPYKVRLSALNGSL